MVIPRRDIDGETVLLAFFLALTTYMFVHAFSFRSVSAQFPQLTASIIIVGSVLLLARNRMPAALQGLMTEDAALIGYRDEGEAIEAAGATGRTEPPREEPDRRFHRVPSTVFTTLSITAYVVLGYLFGLLWVTPVFVAGYMWWYKLRPVTILVVAAVSTAIVYLFIYFLYSPFGRGVLSDLLPFAILL